MKKTCLGPECSRQAKTHGLCQSHYVQELQGRPLTPLQRRSPYACNVGVECGAVLCSHPQDHFPTKLCTVHRRYGLTADQINTLFAEQDGTCAMCGSLFSVENMYHIDHDHECCPSKCRSRGDCIRGLLCGPCNKGLGFYEKYQQLAKPYLERKTNSK